MSEQKPCDCDEMECVRNFIRPGFACKVETHIRQQIADEVRHLPCWRFTTGAFEDQGAIYREVVAAAIERPSGGKE